MHNQGSNTLNLLIILISPRKLSKGLQVSTGTHQQRTLHPHHYARMSPTQYWKYHPMTITVPLRQLPTPHLEMSRVGVVWVGIILEDFSWGNFSGSQGTSSVLRAKGTICQWKQVTHSVGIFGWWGSNHPQTDNVCWANLLYIAIQLDAIQLWNILQHCYVGLHI